jgi:hypothetical protein
MFILDEAHDDTEHIRQTPFGLQVACLGFFKAEIVQH